KARAGPSRVDTLAAPRPVGWTTAGRPALFVLFAANPGRPRRTRPACKGTRSPAFVPRSARSDVHSPFRLHAARAMPALTHLQRLEAESIDILREAVAESERPVMLYSIGKDSSVMLHLARKAFFPARPPFPLLHVDTTWKFRAMYELRDRMARESGLE